MGTFNDISMVFSDIANALRFKTNGSNNYRPNEIAPNINALNVIGSEPPAGSVTSVRYLRQNSWDTTNADYLFADKDAEYFNTQDEIIFDSTVVSARNCFNNSDFNKKVTLFNGITNIEGMFYNTSFNYPIQIPDSVTNMQSTFANSNFNQKITIPENLSGNNLERTFMSSKFNQPIKIPNNVTSLQGTFSSTPFNQSLNIPEGVEALYGTFLNCRMLNSPINIPDTVSNMSYTFNYCTNFNQPIVLPSNISNLEATFGSCTKFAQSINIPVKASGSMAHMFSSCYRFNNATNINISNNITNMYMAFSFCSDLNCKVTLSNNGENASRMFDGCNIFNSKVTIPTSAKIYDLSYMFSDCYNYSQVVTLPSYADNIQGMFYRTIYNSTLYITSNVTQASEIFGDGQFDTVVLGPNINFTNATNLVNISDAYIESSMINSVTFTNMANAKKIEDISGMFYNCWNLKTISGFSSPVAVTNSSFCFANCISLTTGVVINATAPLIDMSYMYYNCQNITTGNINVPATVTNISYMMSNCVNYKGTLKLEVENVIDASHAFENLSAVWYNNITFANDTVYNFANVEDMSYCFANSRYFYNSNITARRVPNIYIGSNVQNLSHAFDNFIFNMQNASSYHLLDITIDGDCSNITNLQNAFQLSSASRLIRIQFSNPILNFDNLYSIDNTFSNDCTISAPPNSILDFQRSKINSISLQSSTDYTSNVEKILFNPQNITGQNFKLGGFPYLTEISDIPQNVTNMARCFYFCTRFNQPITIPQNVTNMYDCFYSCRNFNQPITIPQNVTNMYGCFWMCYNFNQPIIIPQNVTNIAYCFSDANKIKTLYFKNSSNIINAFGLFTNYTNVKIYCTNATPFLSLRTFTALSDGNGYYNSLNNCYIYTNYIP